MKKDEVDLRGIYIAKVSDKLTKVRLDAVNPRGGWDATNLTTGKKIRIKSAQRLRQPVKDEAPARRTAAEPATPANRCSTPNCRGEVEMTYLGKPLCRACWQEVADDDTPAAANDTADAQIDAQDQATADVAPGANVGQTAAAHDAAAKPHPAVARPAGKKTSGLDAAYLVLAANAQPMRCGDLVEKILADGLWKTGGKTPAATLHAAMCREIKVKGNNARFKKTERGLFAANAK